MEFKKTLKNINISKGKPFNLRGEEIWVNLDIFKKFGEFFYYDIYLLRKKVDNRVKIYVSHDAWFDNLISIIGYDDKENYGLFIFQKEINLRWDDDEPMSKDFLLFYSS